MHQRLRILTGAVLVSSSLLVGACGGGGGASKEAFCKALNAQDDEVDFSTVEGADKGAEAFDDLVDKAPDGVKDDVEVLSDAFDEVADAESEADIKKVQQRLQDNDEVNTAIKNVDAYDKKECGSDE